MKKIICFILVFVLILTLMLSSCNIAQDVESGVSESDIAQSGSELLTEPEVEASTAVNENKENESEVEASPTETEPTETESVSETEQTDIPQSSDNEKENDIPPEINTGANGIKLNVYTMEQLYVDLSENEAATEIIELAAYKKYLAIEDELDVDLSLTNIAGKYTSTQVLIDAVKNKTKDVDVMMTSDYRMVEMLIQGLLDDMDRHGSIDWKNGWWPKDANDSFALNGKMYFASGELSTNYAASAHGIFYNADMMLENMTIMNIPELVLEGDWELSSMMEITSNAFSELDGIAGKSNGDIFGLEVTPHALRAVVAGSGFKFADSSEQSDDAVIFFNDLDYKADFRSFIDKLSAYMTTNDILGFKGNDPQNGVAFSEGRSVLLIKELRFAEKLKDIDFEWGVVPPPKLYSSDREYKTFTATNESSTYVAVCKNSKHAEEAAEMIDVMGKYGAEYTTSAFIESAFTKDWLENYNGINTEMLELIIDSVTFDKANIFTMELNVVDITMMNDSINGDGLSVLKGANPFKYKNIQNAFKKLNEKIAALDAD